MNLGRKKYMVKNISMILFILAIAFMGTYIVYQEFNTAYDETIELENLTIVYQDKEKDNLVLENAKPVSDGIGKSSNPIKMTVTNNTEVELDYTVKLLLDNEKLAECKCSDLLLTEEQVKVNVLVNNEEYQTVLLNDLEDGILLEQTLKAKEEANLSFRIWVDQHSLVENNSIYYGKVIIEEK